MLRFATSVFPKPQLMPSRIMAFRGTVAAASMARISAASNMRCPFCCRSQRSSRRLGPTNPGPNRTGFSIRLAS